MVSFRAESKSWSFRSLVQPTTKHIQNKLNQKLGELFGYPQCCIEEFLKFEGNDYVMNSHNNSKKFNFLLNNIIPERIISHFPCSYGCKESIKLAQAISKRSMKNILAKDILLWSEAEYIILDNNFKNQQTNIEKNEVSTPSHGTDVEQ